MHEIFPDFLLADLYSKSIVLVETDEKELSTATLTEKKLIPAAVPAMVSTEKPSKWYLGNNGKKITILVKEPDAVFLNEENLAFLTKILGACKLNMGDIAVVNTKRYSPLFTEIKAELSPLVCILFDVTTNTIQVPFNLPNYQVQDYDDCQFLIAPPLNVFNGNDEAAKLEKTKLWVSLKKIFNL